jgi:Spy/CpxP family protein refolding chaperone
MDHHEPLGADQHGLFRESPVKISFKTLAVIFSVTLNIAFLAGYGIRQMRDESKFAYEELDLSKEQKIIIEAGRDRFLLTQHEIGTCILRRQTELMDLISAGPVDRRAIDAKLEEIHLLRDSMQQHVVNHLLENKQALTPEQRSRFFEILKARIREQGAPGPSWIPEGARRRDE